MDYNKVAKDILTAVGGKDNIKNFEHCATRLRIILNDNSLLNEAVAKKIPEINGYFYQSGQHQFILGTGKVNQVYEIFKTVIHIDNENFQADVYQNLSVTQKLLRILADILIPLIPALVTTGLLMGIRGLLLELGVNFNNDALKIFQMLTDTAFAFLPVLIAYSATKRFGGNPIIGIVIGLMMVAPQLPNAWAVANGEATAMNIQLFGFELPLVGYQGSILPAIFAGWMASYIEKNLRKVIPPMIDLVITPFVTMVFTLLVILFVVGPILQLVEHSVTLIITFLLNVPFGIGYIIFAAFQQLLVVTGLHHALGVIEIGLINTNGNNPLNPLMTASMAGQFGAAIAVATMLKDKLKKANAYSASFSTLFGITEPLLFGINLQYSHVFLYGMAGGAAGGLTTYLTQIAPKGMGITFIPGLLFYTSSLSALLSYILVICISFSTSFVLVRLFVKKIQN